MAACFVAEVAYGNPTGPTVANGQVSFARAGSVLSVTNSPSSIINWQQFSIGAGESTRFIQQSAASAVLNRVVGVDPSSILGTLQSNGRVFLINPSGIVFGAGARVDTAGLVASTLNLSNEDFLGGRLHFASDAAKAAAVVNQGNITAREGGHVYLVGAAVDNQGVITAPNGDIVLAAGSSVRVTDAAGSRLQVEIRAPADSTVNLSEAVYGSRGIYGGLVRNSGAISADAAVRTADGRIVLKASKDVTLEGASLVTASGARGGSVTAQAESGTLQVGGTIDAAGSAAKGGTVQLLGERVALLPGTRVDVSGETGGGTVLVGGDYQGANPDIQNSVVTYVGNDVTIKADAVTNGDGGKVVVWADDTTRFGGTISARGGSKGGDGGFVEVSGKNTLVFKGAVDTRAPEGRTGMLLLDPANIVIANGAGDSTDDGDALNNSFSGAPSGAIGTVIGTDDPVAGTLTLFESELQGIAATTSISLAATSNITINNLADNLLNLAQTAGNSVTFNAGGTFSMTAGDTIQTAGGALNITALGGATIGALATGGGAITIDVGAASTASGVISGVGTSLVKQGTGTLTLSGANTFSGGSTIKAGTVNANTATALGTGTVTLGDSAGGSNAATLTSSNTGSVTYANPIVLASNTTGALTIGRAAATGTKTFSGGVTGNNNLILAANINANINFTGAINNAGTITNSGTGTGLATISGGVGSNVTAITESSATSALTISTNALTVNGGGTTLTTDAGAQVFTVSGGVTGTGDLILNNNSATNGRLTLTTNSVNNTGTITNSGAGAGSTTITASVGANVTEIIENSATSALTVSGAVTTTGSKTFTNSNASGSSLLTVTGAVTGAGNLVLNNNSAIANGITFSGAGTVNNAGTITNSGTGSGASLISKIISTNVTGVVQDSATSQLTLGGVNTFTTGVAIKSGTVRGITSAAAFGTGTITIGDGSGTANATLSGGLAGTFANAISVASGNTGTATITDTANSTFSGAVTLNTHDLTLTAAANTLALSGGMTGAGNLTLNATGAGVITKSGTVNNTGTITNSGAGAATNVISAAIGSNVTDVVQNSSTSALTLSGTNTYSGATNVNAGALNANGGSAIPNSSQVTLADLAGAVLNLGTSETIGNLSGGGTSGGNVTLGANTLTVNEAGSTTYSGVISGAGGLTKTGTGTLTLSGANLYAGTTTVSAGTLVAANADALGTTAAGTAVSSGATLDINNAAIGNEAISIVGNGAGGVGALTGTGAATLAGTLTLTGASRAGTTSGASALTLNGAVSAGGNALDVTGAGDLTATNALNDFGTVTINSAGNISLVDANALTIGASSVGTLTAQTLSGNLTLGGNITATGTGDTIVLAAAANFDNTGGFSLDPNAGSGGRWLVYTTSPAGSIEGGLTSAAGSALPRLYGRTYAGNPPGTLSESGNHLIYSTAPSLTVTPDNKSKVYGSNDPAQTYVAAGYVIDDGVTDTATTAGLTGSFARTAGETVVAPGPSYAITQGTFTSDAGYSISFTGGQTLTITQAALTASIANQTKVYGADDPAVGGIGVTLGGLINNPALVTWNGNVGVDDSALTSSVTSLARQVGEDVGARNITGGVFSAASGNYGAPTLTGAPTLAITQAALSVTADPQNKTYGAIDPALTYSATGLVNATVTDWNGINTVISDSVVGAFSGALTRAAGEAVAGSPYAITQGTLAASGNYNLISFTGNSLTITPASLSITADNASRPVNQANPPFSATYSGLQGGDTPASLAGTLTFSTPATTSSPVGAYAITPFGQSSTNYAITHIDGTLTVTGGLPPLFNGIVDPVTNLIVSGFQQLGSGGTYWSFIACPGTIIWPLAACVNQDNEPGDPVPAPAAQNALLVPKARPASKPAAHGPRAALRR